jgi:prevent-host-death family protein
VERTWNLQDAKARLSELVDRARGGEVQIILRRGQRAAVLIGYDAYQRAAGPAQSMLSFLQHAPIADLKFEVLRTTEKMRDIE